MLGQGPLPGPSARGCRPYRHSRRRTSRCGSCWGSPSSPPPWPFCAPRPPAAAAVKNPNYIGRLVGSGPMLERNTVLDLALESAMPAVGAYERLVAQAHEQALADADAGALPVSSVER